MKPGARPQGSAPPLAVNFDAAVSLAIPLRPDEAQPCCFHAPAAHSAPYALGSFNGEVARGASCNCRSVTLVPHCNGTHTESVGHLTLRAPDLYSLVPAGPIPALLLSVTAEPAGAEDSVPAPQPQDRLLTRAAILRAWPPSLPRDPRALVLRTLPNDPGKSTRDYSGTNPPYLSRQAAIELVDRGIEHLVVDLPSLDRSQDEGRLCAHRVFFGLPASSTELADATRAHCTVTELAYVPDEVPDGYYALQIQVPAMAGDAVPSRPLLLPVCAP